MLNREKCLVDSNKFITFVVGIPGYSSRRCSCRRMQKEKRSASGIIPFANRSRKEVLNMVFVSSAGFEPAKTPKSQHTYRMPQLSRLASFLW
jgi:hypothetical protein